MSKEQKSIEQKCNRQFYDCLNSKSRYLIHIGGSRCLRGDTYIKTNNGYIKARDVTKETNIATHNGYEKPSEIIINKPDKQVYKINLKSGETIYCTQDHEFFTKDGGSASLKLLLSLWNGSMENNTKF